MAFESNEMLFFVGRAAILVVAFLAFAVIFWRWRSAGQRDMQRLFNEVEQLHRESRGLVELVGVLSGGVSLLDEKFETRAQLSAAAAGNGPRGYELALRLARSGAAVDEIAETSGVTRPEAQLLARLHGPDTVRMRTGT
ncbi:MAG: DUF2802 domain-containing protein [Pseudomonadota bacterium]